MNVSFDKVGGTHDLLDVVCCILENDTPPVAALGEGSQDCRCIILTVVLGRNNTFGSLLQLCGSKVAEEETTQN